MLNIDFYYTTIHYIKEHLKLSKENSLVVFRNFEERQKVLDDELDISIKRMKKFIEEFSQPLVKVYD